MECNTYLNNEYFDYAPCHLSSVIRSLSSDRRSKVMLLLVAGGIRENVIAVIADTLNQIKTTVTEKTEYFV